MLGLGLFESTCVAFSSFERASTMYGHGERAVLIAHILIFFPMVF
jgi:hypothetical protein